jgi:hypothetical protein
LITATLTVDLVDESGRPVPEAEVTVFNIRTSALDQRYSDGNGHTDCQVEGEAADLFVITTNGYRVVGSTVDPHIGGAPTPYYYRLTSEVQQRVVLTFRPFKRPAGEFPRFWQANMCGITIEGLPPRPEAGRVPGLFLSWLYHLYDDATRAYCREVYLADYTHWLLSWPDARDAGLSPGQFAALCREIEDAGGRVCVMLSAKPTSSGAVVSIGETLADILRVLPALLEAGVLGYCVGWELSLWMTPDDLQWLIDALVAWIVPAGRLYVHLQEGYGSFQQPGTFFVNFWAKNVGKLTGILRQEIMAQSPNERRYGSGGVVDVLLRFCGYFGMPTDSGFGHPFDDVELEISANNRFNGVWDEATSDAYGQWAIDTPPQTGPTGVTVGVMGSGNGRLRHAA